MNDDGQNARHDWPPTEYTAQPVVLPGDRVLFSSGYGVGARMFRIRADGEGAVAADLIWESLGLKAKFTIVSYREVADA